MAIVAFTYYAAAREAAGVASETFEAESVRDAVTQAAAKHGQQLARILEKATLLIDGERFDGSRQQLSADINVDVLPPFAGG